MKTLLKIIYIGLFSALLTSCGVSKVYTSASYGALKTYTEKPIYNGKREVATYISGSLRNSNHPQHLEDNKRINDKVLGGNFSIYRTTTDKKLNFYYGLGASFGSYQFNSDLENINPDLETIFSRNDKLNYYNINLKAGINHTKTWKKFEYSIIGLEFIYVNEFGPYIDKLSHLAPQVHSDVVIADEKSILAFNLNTEITYRINKDNNIGVGFFLGSVFLNNKEKIRNEGTSISGSTLKYNHKNITLSIINENSTRDILSTRIGITYKIKPKK